jgi:hypothetical protein
MDLDRRILVLVRQGPGAVPLHHLCLLLFPTFSLWQMSPILNLLRWRCHALVLEGRLCEVAADRFIVLRPGRRRYQA